LRLTEREELGVDPAERVRLRTLTAALVWVVTLLAFGLWGCFPAWGDAPHLTILAVAFVLTWTALLLGLLRRLHGA
jgi:hypothetical protein